MPREPIRPPRRSWARWARAYHADMFYDQAQRSYALAERLSGSDWHWTYHRALAQGARGRCRRARRRPAPGGCRGARLQPGLVAARRGRIQVRALRPGRRSLAARPVAARAGAAASATAGSPARVASAPLSAYATLGLARLALMQGDTDGARDMLESVTANAPRFGPAFRASRRRLRRAGPSRGRRRGSPGSPIARRPTIPMSIR